MRRACRRCSGYDGGEATIEDTDIMANTPLRSWPGGSR